jgi:hypothetical protein
LPAKSRRQSRAVSVSVTPSLRCAAYGGDKQINKKEWLFCSVFMFPAAIGGAPQRKRYENSNRSRAFWGVRTGGAVFV